MSKNGYGNSILDKGPSSDYVNYLTLQPVQTIPLRVLKTKTGFGWSLDLRYSGNVTKGVQKPNLLTPVSWVGMGWSLGSSAIFAEQGQTRDMNDDRWYFVSGDGTISEILRSGQNFVIERKPYWKVSPSVDPNIDPNMANILGWEVIDENGTKYRFGDFTNTPPFNASRNILASSDHFWMPCDDQVTCTGFGPHFYRWDIQSIEDASHGKLTFTYQQFREGPAWKSYTRESYLMKVESDNGDCLEFELGDKEVDEIAIYRSPQFFKQVETKFLDKVIAYDASGTELEEIQFGYSSSLEEPYHINNLHRGSAKRLLLSVNSDRNLALNLGFNYSPSGFLLKKTVQPLGGSLAYAYTDKEIRRNLRTTLTLTGLTQAELDASQIVIKGNHIFVRTIGAGGYTTKLNIIDFVDNKWVRAALPHTIGSGTHIYPGEDYYVETIRLAPLKFILRVWEWRNKRWESGEFKKIQTYATAVPGQRELELDEALTVVETEKSYFIVFEKTHPEQAPMNNGEFGIPRSRRMYIYNKIDEQWVSTFNAREGAEFPPPAIGITQDFHHDQNGEGWNLPQPIFGLQWRSVYETIFTSGDRFSLQYGLARIESHAWGDCFFGSCWSGDYTTPHAEYLFETYQWTGRSWEQTFLSTPDPLYANISSGAKIHEMGRSFYTYASVPGGMEPLHRNNGFYRHSAAMLRSRWDDLVDDDESTSPTDWIFALSGKNRTDTRFDDDKLLATIPFDNGDFNHPGYPRIMSLRMEVPSNYNPIAQPPGPYSWTHLNNGLNQVDPYTLRHPLILLTYRIPNTFLKIRC